MKRLTPRGLVVLAGAACFACQPSVIAEARPVSTAPVPGADSPRQVHRPAGPRAPSGPPIVSAQGAASASPETDASTAPIGQPDPLVSNGLGSPLCSGALDQGELDAAASHNCATSGFVAAASPTANYSLDVHIDRGLLGLSEGGLLSIVQEIVIAPIWQFLVISVHALVVALEWAFTLDLTREASGFGLSSLLRGMESGFTTPWLALTLAVAAVAIAHNGLVRRTVTESLNQAVVMTAMMGAGLWVIVDPVGTLGAVGAWADEASLGTLAVAASGRPSGPGRALSHGMEAIYGSAIEAPWCYLEFGDVAWCRDSGRLEPRMRRAALGVGAVELALIGCRDPLGAIPCVAAGTAQAKALQTSARLLKEARTNADVFLAVPANGWARNSVTQHGSLLQVLCGSSDESSCRGPTAAQAQFRTNAGTWPRLGGLALIAVGDLGMLLLLGFVALRLLAAAVLSLFLLLLTPAMVLAPAFGERGRELFRRWGTQLLGAVASKLVFAFLLGVLLAVAGGLSRLPALGWWSQWLLASAFWWAAFLYRHRVLDLAQGPIRQEPRRRGLLRRASDAAAPAVQAAHTAEMIKARRRRQVREKPRTGSVQEHAQQAPPAVIRSERRDQAHSFADARAREDRAVVAREPDIGGRLEARRARLERVRREHSRASADGDRRRAVSLATRAARIEEQIKADADQLRAARARVRTGGWTAVAGRGESWDRLGEQERYLDRQARLPASSARVEVGGSGRRDYATLATLAGYGDDEYRRLDPGRKREVRREVDRELALRSQVAAMATEPASVADPATRPSDRAARAAEQRERPAGAPEWGQSMPASRMGTHRERTRVDGRHGAAVAEESVVMRDAREVAARRKRQLGLGRD